MQVPRSPSRRRQVPQHGLLRPLSGVPGAAGAPALLAGAGGGGEAGSGSFSTNRKSFAAVKSVNKCLKPHSPHLRISL